MKLIEKGKGNAPEEWPGYYDWDKQPVPPPMDEIYARGNDEYSDEEED